MNAGRLSVTWSRSSRVAQFAVAFYSFIALLPAQPGAQMQFVKMTSEHPPSYAPPVGLTQADRLALRVIGLPPQAAISLHVYGLLNRSADRAYEKNQTALLATLESPELRTRGLATGSGDLLVPLPEVQLQSVLEVTATLIGAGGTAVGQPASLTIDSRTSLQAAPSWLQRITSSALVDRFLNLYQVVREDPEPTTIYTVALKGGKASSEPMMLPLDRAQYRSLALSPAGDRLAWAIKKPEGYELWTSGVNEIRPARSFVSPAPILTPSFASEDLLLFIVDGSLMLARTAQSQPPRRVSTPFRKLLRIDAAWSTGGSIEGIVSARHPDVADLDLPYRVHVPLPDGVTSAFRLAQNPLYQSYSLLVEGVPLFYAGSEDGVEGIYYMQLGDSNRIVNNLCKIHHPGLVAVASSGNRLIFTGSP
jgi:hypothetical protein